MEQNLEFSLLSAYILLSFFLFLLNIKIRPKIFNGKLLDNDFQKPQAFHSILTPRTGGLALGDTSTRSSPWSEAILNASSI